MVYADRTAPYGEKRKCARAGCSILFQPTVSWKTKKFCSRSCVHLGRTSWNKGLPNIWYNPKGLEIGRTLSKGRIVSDTTREKLRQYFTGRKHSLATRKMMSEKLRGPNASRWEGGKTKETKIIRRSFEYREWRKHVFQRDDYTCQACGQRGGTLHADHELPFSLFPALRFEILNGRTLCVACHKKTPTYGGKSDKLHMIYAL